MLAKRDAENARLRDQREQQAAELNERKHKESVKAASFQELKLLADSRSVSIFFDGSSLALLRPSKDRILVLESEVRRCKTHMAANASNKDLMLFFADGNTENVDYIVNLKDRITSVLQCMPFILCSDLLYTGQPRIEQLRWSRHCLYFRMTTQMWLNI